MFRVMSPAPPTPSAGPPPPGAGAAEAEPDVVLIDGLPAGLQACYAQRGDTAVIVVDGERIASVTKSGEPAT